ncbi:MAG: UDP-N-acetylmuramoyl-tripeptide--D-alanyl-D-alanine ligase [Gemmatimonadaceae bacterium]|nr:UDP-N-acetylmuramoyl-tripeptide--D-alanyl-D-alanine ligase [Gemmatimonadaceae bacterium]NUQ94711.1 UDP-N-acetylmuramoyl-tripeptide--D-alanyl-D-alanine ligase [Gemmatimonadaceae bacterium]NUR17987.1 UDP-N-acetylmuramoyl-tripeptide--D-alanyl-D-alanine ligase [Gemmatimonadaceae bacterium]
MSGAFWTMPRIAEALRDDLATRAPEGDRSFSAVSTDTRTIVPGSLFLALRGENHDAHDHLAEAVSKGASGLVVSDPARASSLGVPVWHVRDTLHALGALGAFRRRAWGRRVVGVTGSNGKTSTKELLRAALGSRFRVHATQGNLNNQIGVPLTLLALPDDAEIAVIEMGTSLPGEIAILRAIAGPDISVVTSIAEAHLEELKSLDGVRREKSSIFDGVAVAVVPATEPEVVALARTKAARVVVAGLGEGDVRATGWGRSEAAERAGGWLEVEGTRIEVPLRGEHNLRNAMLAVAVARECGIALTDVARGIAAMEQPKMRLAAEPLGRATLINDAYNANPGSTRAAIDLLAGSGDGRQRVLVLGTMRELGAGAAALHAEIAKRAVESSIDLVAGIGEFAPALAALGDARVVTATDVDDLWPKLRAKLAPDAVILLKASRGVKLERLVPHLTAWAGESR